MRALSLLRVAVRKAGWAGQRSPGRPAGGARAGAGGVQRWAPGGEGGDAAAGGGEGEGAGPGGEDEGVERFARGGGEDCGQLIDKVRLRHSGTADHYKLSP